MIKLSDRLQLIADKINKGEMLADIGTDHGLLPVYLLEAGVCPSVIMADISEPSLAKAVALTKEKGLGSRAEFRAGDGLKILAPGETDVVVIAGMGGILMTEILGEDLTKSRSISRLVLQPRNRSGYLRWWLASNGFTVTCNDLVREGKFICEIITAAQMICEPDNELRGWHDSGKAHKNLPDADDMSWDLPDNIGKNDPMLRDEFLQRKLNTEEKILAGLKQGNTIDIKEILAAESRIGYIKSFLQEVK